jgi:magnesium-transporting ATPase (P-type)
MAGLDHLEAYFYTNSRSGLSEEQVKRAREKYGPNEISRQNEDKLLALIIKQIKSPLVFILIIAGHLEPE